MSRKYHQLKQTKYVWLNSYTGTIIKDDDNGWISEMQWDVNQNLNMSSNAKVSVCAYASIDVGNVAVPTIIRCKNIPSTQTLTCPNKNMVFNGVAQPYNPNHSYPIIHMGKHQINEQIQMEPLIYDVGDENNWRTINLVIGSLYNCERGFTEASHFIICLKFQDYDVIEVQPSQMETMRPLDKYPQDRLFNKFV